MGWWGGREKEREEKDLIWHPKHKEEEEEKERWKERGKKEVPLSPFKFLREDTRGGGGGVGGGGGGGNGSFPESVRQREKKGDDGIEEPRTVS